MNNDDIKIRMVIWQTVLPAFNLSYLHQDNVHKRKRILIHKIISVNMKKQFLTFLAAGVIMVAGGCYYDVEEDLYPSGECVTENQSYASDIVPILQTNCYVCHAQGVGLGGVTLEGYNNAKTYATNGKLVGVINHSAGFPAMPQGAAKLSDCNISKIESWVTAGAPNN